MENTWVSYVYCDRTKGDSGTRSRANIKNEPLSVLRKDRNIRIIDTDLTYEQAARMLSLTPEICRFTHKLEILYSENNKFRRNEIDFIFPLLLGACKRIIEDRADRKKYNLIPSENYHEYFVDVNAGNSEKYQLFRRLNTIIEIRPDGSIVDLKSAFMALLSQFIDYQFAVWEKENN